MVSTVNCFQIRWEYYQEMSDFQGKLAGQIDVEHAVSATQVIQNILGIALDNLSSLQVVFRIHANVQFTADADPQHKQDLTASFACRLHTSKYSINVTCSDKKQKLHRSMYRTMSSRNTRKKQSYTSRSEQLVRFCSLCGAHCSSPCFVPQFAAVLNEKKAKAIEWKQKAEQAQESVQKASNEVNFIAVHLIADCPCKYRIWLSAMY